MEHRMEYSLEIDESVGLMPSGQRGLRNEEKSSGGSKLMQASAVVTALLALAFLVTGNTGNNRAVVYTQQNEIQNAKKASNEDIFSVKIQVKLPNYDEVKVLESLPWTAIAEPFKDNAASIVSLTLNNKQLTTEEMKHFDFTWNIAGVKYQSEKAFIRTEKTGVFDASLTATLNKDLGAIPSGTSYVYDFSLASKYVRREIRTLNDFDRQKYFQTLKLLYTLDEATGQKIYGEKFHSAEYFQFKHLTGAGTSDCDHWHDGAGIVTHHAAISLEFEQVLQSIDPSLSNPYWEYGQDAYLYDTLDESPIFQADWYGERNPLSADHAIRDGGLWEGITVPRGQPYKSRSVAKSLNPYVNGYGMMRSPWNNNPSALIGRHNLTYTKQQYSTVPNCVELSSCYASDDLATMFHCLNGATHGPVHIMIGGAWGEGDTLSNDYTEKFKLPNKLLLFKVLWRYGYTRCPTDCAEGSECKCSVPQAYIDKFGAKGILRMSGILAAFSMEEESEQVCAIVLKALEDSGVVGEMYSSSASFDPSFWPLHGSIERMVNLKRSLVARGEADFDETWTYPSYSSTMLATAAYLDGVCDWSGVKDANDLTLPVCTMGAWCTGHYETDVIEFTNFLNKGETYTNGQMYAFINPWNDDLPYTYDTFDFDYCASYGHDFDKLNSAKKSSKGSSVVAKNFGSPMRRV